MEDYKKKYEQAMLRMNKWAEGSEIIEPKEVAEFIFPELKESEDERIRKSLIEYIKGITSWNYFLGISKEQMISWLEKQGELKPTGKMQVNEIPEKYQTCDWLWNYGSIGLTKEHIKKLNNAINILESLNEHTDAKYLKEIKDKLLEDTPEPKIEKFNTDASIEKACK